MDRSLDKEYINEYIQDIVMYNPSALWILVISSDANSDIPCCFFILGHQLRIIGFALLSTEIVNFCISETNRSASLPVKIGVSLIGFAISITISANIREKTVEAI